MPGPAARGFGRFKAEFASMPNPDTLEGWFGLGASADGAPEPVRRALADLDDRADEMVKPDALRERLEPWPENLHEKFFGLDMPSPKERLRASVARAWRVAWRYAEAWCDRRDEIEEALRLADQVAAFVERMGPEGYDCDELRSSETWGRRQSPALRGGEILDRWRWVDHPDQQRRIALAMADIADYGATLQAWASAIKREPVKIQEPQYFLLLRLAEIYAGNFGRRATLHQTGREGKNRLSPDMAFAEFVTIVYRCLSSPTAATSRDRQLRRIAIDMRTAQWGLEELSKAATEAFYRKHRIAYGSFPSIGLLNDLKTYSKEDL